MAVDESKLDGGAPGDPPGGHHRHRRYRRWSRRRVIIVVLAIITAVTLAIWFISIVTNYKEPDYP